MDFMLSDADRVLISQVREFGKNYFNNEVGCAMAPRYGLAR